MVSNFIEHFNRYTSLLGSAFSKPENNKMYRQELFRQMVDIGIGSLSIIAIISTFLGAVTAVQFIFNLKDSFLPLYWIGYVVRDAMIMELAPTICCLILAGKVGSNIASEIGGMRQKEQIDALEIMGVNTAAYLIMPRILGGIIVIPMLVILASFLGMIGGLIASAATGLLPPADYDYGLRIFFAEWNIVLMLIKAFVFAFLIISISAYQGYFVKGGSIELGEASTRAVVFSNIAILLADYIIASVFT